MPDLPDLMPDPMLSFRFLVVFLNRFKPFDMRFQKVSGLSASIETKPITGCGHIGDNASLVESVSYGDLELERGLIFFTTSLADDFEKAMETLKVRPANVLISLLDKHCLPLRNWLVHQAYPQKWSIGEFSGDSNSVVVETMIFKYRFFESIGL